MLASTYEPGSEDKEEEINQFRDDLAERLKKLRKYDKIILLGGLLRLGICQ